MKEWKETRKEILSKKEVAREYDNITSVEIAAKIINARTKRGLTQSDLASLVKTSQSAVARLESGKYCGCSLKTLAKIANALGFNLKISFSHG